MGEIVVVLIGLLLLYMLVKVVKGVFNVFRKATNPPIDSRRKKEMIRNAKRAMESLASSRPRAKQVLRMVPTDKPPSDQPHL
jgi:hypothetical protein